MGERASCPFVRAPRNVPMMNGLEARSPRSAERVLPFAVVGFAAFAQNVPVGKASDFD